MLDFRVRTFLTVCRTLNYTRAAEELNITQPAVSQHIAYLERLYGAKLFALRGKKPQLTDAGRLLRGAFTTMAHDELLLHERVAALVEDHSITLHIGATLTAGEFIVARPLARWLAERPDARMTLYAGDTRELLDLLAEGTIDSAFIEGPFNRSAYRCDELCTERLVCVCAPDHPRAGSTCRIEDLLDERLIVREPGSGTRAVLENALTARNLSVAAFGHVGTASSIGVIKTLVEGGAGISFLYRAAVRDELRDGRLGAIEIAGAPIEHPIAFVRLANSVFEGQFARFFDEIRELMQA